MFIYISVICKFMLIVTAAAYVRFFLLYTAGSVSFQAYPGDFRMSNVDFKTPFLLLVADRKPLFDIRDQRVHVMFWLIRALQKLLTASLREVVGSTTVEPSQRTLNCKPYK